MKLAVFAALATLSLMASYGQGQVVFGNLGGGVDAPVIWIGDFRGLGPQYTAQLFLRDSIGGLTPLMPASTFREAGMGASAIADRYWIPKTVDVPGVQPGNSATFVVRVWPTAYGSFEAACPFGLIGQSLPVTVPVGGGLFPPSNLNGLQGFTFGVIGPASCVPEPTTTAFMVLGALFLSIMVERRASKRGPSV